MPRGAAVVYPKDAAQIVAMADIFPGRPRGRGRRRVRGADLLAAARGRALRPRLVVRAPRGVRRHRAPQRHPVLRRASTRRGRLTVGDLAECLPAAEQPGSVDRVVLDMLAPWECVDVVADALAPGGIVVRVRRDHDPARPVVETLRAHGEFTEPQPWETLVRDWHVEGLAVRPGHKMNGHTGFLVTARRMAPGNAAPVKKRRPAPGAYGVDYEGPRPVRRLRRRRLEPGNGMFSRQPDTSDTRR